MPTIRTAAPWFVDEAQPEQFAVAARIGSTIVLNLNSMALTANPSNPYGVLSGASTNHGNVIVWPVPVGCSYLDIFHEWRGTNPTTRPVVRVYGEVPPPSPGQRYWPVDADADYFNPSSVTFSMGVGAAAQTYTSGDWVPLGDMKNNVWELTIGDTTTPVGLDNGTSKRSVPTSVWVRGCRRILATISTAATDATEGMIVGNFCR